MTMFSWHVMKALEALNKVQHHNFSLIKKIIPAYDGIIITLDDDTVYKYFYESKSIQKLEYWRKGVQTCTK